MAGISSSVGLISGLDIDNIVSQLMAIEKRPLTLLQNQKDDATNQKTALLELSALLLALQTKAKSLASADTFSTYTAQSSNPAVLSATVDGSSLTGTYSFRVNQTVGTSHYISQGFADSDSTPIGAGDITIELGQGSCAKETFVDSLNGGAGIDRGYLRITDRSGASAAIDLTSVVTVADVLDRINNAENINVTASVSGDSLVITDNTGQTASNLTVASAVGYTTAEDLGIASSVSDTQITGSDIVAVTATTGLRNLNDGNGVSFKKLLDDFRITRHDGVTIDVDLTDAHTLQDVLDLINNDSANADGLLTARIAATGDGIELVDNSAGASNLAVTALNGSAAASDLGILGEVAGGGSTLTGGRIIAGLNTVLLKSLNGGSGIAAGSISIQDRSGASATIDLTDAVTLQDVLDAINASSAISITASLNEAGTRIVLTDTSGGTGNLIVADVDSTTAADLGISTYDADTGTNPGIAANILAGTNVQLRYISESTLLADLNGGKGIDKGQFTITNSLGVSATVDLTQDTDTTIGDVIQEINSRGINVTARINDTGDGIILEDSAGGAMALEVANVGSSTTATDLNLAGTATETNPTQIDGSFEIHVTLDADDTLMDLVNKLDAASSLIDASIINSGSAVNPYRLSLASRVSGTKGALVVDTSGSSLDLSAIQKAQDAVVTFGSYGGGAKPIVIVSSTNTISDVIPGVTLTAHAPSDTPVTVSIQEDDSAVVQTIQDFVDKFNSVIDKIKSATKYDEESGEKGILLGNYNITRIQNSLYNIIINPVAGVSNVGTLSRLGITIDKTGKLVLDSEKLQQALNDYRDDVIDLFTKTDVGIGARIEEKLDFLTDEYDGYITRMSDALDDKIDLYDKRMDNLALILAKRETRLRAQFYHLEQILIQLQSQQNAVASFPTFTMYGEES